MLFLSESVRDVVDIKLSKKYNPPVNILGNDLIVIGKYLSDIILDTPCTAASHLLTRDPDTAKIWFQERRGCFERPSLARPRKQVSIPKLQGRIYIICFY